MSAACKRLWEHRTNPPSRIANPAILRLLHSIRETAEKYKQILIPERFL
jgi:hypothetical protein